MKTYHFKSHWRAVIAALLFNPTTMNMDAVVIVCLLAIVLFYKILHDMDDNDNSPYKFY